MQGKSYDVSHGEESYHVTQNNTKHGSSQSNIAACYAQEGMHRIFSLFKCLIQSTIACIQLSYLRFKQHATKVHFSFSHASYLGQRRQYFTQ